MELFEQLDSYVENKIAVDNGVDSYPARCAAVIAGATETIFYISAVYFSACKVRKLRYAIPVAIL